VVHPDDQPILNKALPALTAALRATEHVEVGADPSLPRGSCIARTPSGGIIDASIDVQLQRMVEQILGAPPGAAP
jgi:flagellar biosynthesis/type III secretory pathway protein FliH